MIPNNNDKPYTVWKNRMGASLISDICKYNHKCIINFKFAVDDRIKRIEFEMIYFLNINKVF
jgi:hypothetical protein